MDAISTLCGAAFRNSRFAESIVKALELGVGGANTMVEVGVAVVVMVGTGVAVAAIADAEKVSQSTLTGPVKTRYRLFFSCNSAYITFEFLIYTPTIS